jgi:hypothetical protein
MINLNHFELAILPEYDDFYIQFHLFKNEFSYAGLIILINIPLILFLITDVMHAPDRMRVVTSHKNYKLLIHNNRCVTSVNY